jgi:hypothetical protein
MEQRPRVIRHSTLVNQRWEEPMEKAKPFAIPKRAVWSAYKKVRANNRVLRHLNRALVHWVRRKYKKLARHRRRAEYWLGRLARREPRLFAHWQMGILPSAG